MSNIELLTPTTPSGPRTKAERRAERRATTRRARRTTIDRAGFHMLRLYRTNLEVRLRCIDETSLHTQNQKQTYASVSEILKPHKDAETTETEAGWDEAYRAERMIEMLLSGVPLRQEISSRLDELAMDSAIEAERFRGQYDTLSKLPAEGQPDGDDAALRSLLLRIMERVHWHAKKRYLSRPVRKQATKNVLWCMIVAFLLAIAPYVFMFTDFQENKELSSYWTLFALYTTLVSGLLGAFFSRLITIQRDWANMPLEEVFLHREISYSLLRASVGMCGAVVVYFFFKSGLIDGAIFPKFENIAMQWIQVPDGSMSFVVPSKDLALLTVWCFLAGFSESLVPSILSSTERQFAESTASGKGPGAQV